MSEKPILFNTEMVRAILDGRKTQTRRLIKPQPPCTLKKMTEGQRAGEWHLYQDSPMMNPTTNSPWGAQYSPQYHPGDILWVRETWNGLKTGNEKFGHHKTFWYKADEKDGNPDDKWRPSIHMPRAAARLFLRIIDVRTERLQDMTEEDAICEGYDGMPWCYHHVFENYPDSPIPCDASSGYDCPPDRPCDKSIPELFGETIWNPTIKKSDLDRYGWEANPWVWVIEFERYTP